MGTDITMYVEINKDGKWKYSGELWENEYYDPNKPESDWNRRMTDQPYSYRNYDLFAILADVRNGVGFAGVVTGFGFSVISPPRGFPEDADYYLYEKYREWASDAYAPSWLTLKEILDFDWDQVTTKTGVLTIEEYERCKGGIPSSYAGDVEGPLVIVLTPDTPEQYYKMKERGLNPNLHYYVRHYWKMSYRDAVGKYWWDTLDRIQKTCNADPEDIRLVFWFEFDC